MQHKQFDIDQWKAVPQEACRLAKLAAGPAQVISDIWHSLPDTGSTVWYNPDREKVILNHKLDVDTQKTASWHIALRQIPGIEEVVHTYISPPPIDEPYIQIKAALENKTLFGPVADAAMWRPNAVNRLWGGPNPLSSTIAGGLLGAGLGYGGGWLAEQVLPEDKFEKGKLRRTLSVLGGAAGAAPGIWSGFDKQFRGPEAERGIGAWITPFEKQNCDSRFKQICAGLIDILPEEATELSEQWVKAANEAGGEFGISIPVDQFNRTIWNDLRGIGGFTSPQIAAATTGIVQAASLSQGGINYISPADVARIGIGMGAGYLSGALVGKTLGALAGLRPEAQKTLQQTGTWAGILSNVVPLIFR